MGKERKGKKKEFRCVMYTYYHSECNRVSRDGREEGGGRKGIKKS